MIIWEHASSNRSGLDRHLALESREAIWFEFNPEGKPFDYLNLGIGAAYADPVDYTTFPPYTTSDFPVVANNPRDHLWVGLVDVTGVFPGQGANFIGFSTILASTIKFDNLAGNQNYHNYIGSSVFGGSNTYGVFVSATGFVSRNTTTSLSCLIGGKPTTDHVNGPQEYKAFNVSRFVPINTGQSNQEMTVNGWQTVGNSARTNSSDVDIDRVSTLHLVGNNNYSSTNIPWNNNGIPLGYPKAVFIFNPLSYCRTRLYSVSIHTANLNF